MQRMLAPLSRRGLLRPKALAIFTFALVLTYILCFRSPESSSIPLPSKLRPNYSSSSSLSSSNAHRPIQNSGSSSGQSERPAELEKPETPEKPGSMVGQGTQEGYGYKNGESGAGQSNYDNAAWEESAVKSDSAIRKMTAEQMKKQWRAEYEFLENQPEYGAIYGNTLATLDYKKMSHLSNEAHLKPTQQKTLYSVDRPYVYDPYPDYNSQGWLKTHAEVVACEGPNGRPVEDVQVFKGHPHNFPEPGWGSYESLGLDGNLCFERDTRLGPYGLNSNYTDAEQTLTWDKVSWGELQESCVTKNKARFDLEGQPNPFVKGVYKKRQLSETFGEETAGPQKFTFRRDHLSGISRSQGKRQQLHARRGTPQSGKSHPGQTSHSTGLIKEERTALLLRSYTGKKYSENDKQVIRSLITELSLRTGGRYQVYLFVHVKDTSYAIWDDAPTYQYVLQTAVPKEFRDITILWNDEATQAMYTALDPKQATVHVSQWLSVQKFAQEFPEYDYIWNWEMDARITGHNYDIIEKLASFAKDQPRRGLWERNERFYIPAVHGKYEKEFRKEVEQKSQGYSVWGAPALPFVKPVGPHPPTARPEDDDYQWGVGEEADLITLSPIFNPDKSGWVSVNELWGYNDSSHATKDLPRRATIITHSRVSKRLLDIMHVENLRGNHISAEMATQTTAFLHGLKAVYAPIPVWFDRGWTGKDLNRWFNPGPNGTAGGHGCAMAWGQEARYAGSTWYFRADPPQRMYLNWMGWEDTAVGGPEWESSNGRPCLPPMIFHPVKDIEPTESGYQSESKLPYD